MYSSRVLPWTAVDYFLIHFKHIFLGLCWSFHNGTGSIKTPNKFFVIKRYMQNYRTEIVISATLAVSLSCMIFDQRFEKIRPVVNIITATGEMPSSMNNHNNHRRLLQYGDTEVIDKDIGYKDKFVLVFTRGSYHIKGPKSFEDKRRYSPRRNLLLFQPQTDIDVDFNNNADALVFFLMTMTMVSM
jgi:hypothetical protein